MTPERTFILPPARSGDAAPRRYRFDIGYDGTEFSGWQVQPHHRSIQGEIEAALERLTGTRPRVHSSGRTDAGVHARAQVAHADLPGRRDPLKLRLGLNACLPPAIRILAVRPVSADFHARYSATGKEYRYFIYNGPVLPPHRARYATLERRPLDLAAMRAAARQLVGRHDFAAFSANPNREIDGTVRRLRGLAVLQRGREFTIVARGDGFLYRMVRSLAGFLLRVGRGEVPPADAAAILASTVRTARVPTAPPQGLFLWRVTYAAPPRRRPRLSR